MTRITLLVMAAIVATGAGHAADKPKEGPVALEEKLRGAWNGPACGGNWTFKADGTFAAEHYSPGNNKLTGTWAVRWNALPPTLALTMQTSDAPERIKVGETWEVKLIRLDDEALDFVWPQNPGHPTRWTRAKN
jgi:hypothetical protein